MRICVFGAGAVGGYIAGYLARGGAEVSVVARGAHLHAIQARGLTVEAPDETFTVRVAASDDPARLGVQDAVLATVKAHALPHAAPMMAPLLRADTPVAFLNNGIPWWYFDGHGGPWDGMRLERLDPGEAIRRAIGPGRTVGGIVWPASAVPEPGVVRVRSPKGRPTMLGAPAGAASPGTLALAEAFRAAGLPVSIEPALRDRIWEKLAFNWSAGPFCVLTETPVADVQTQPALVEASRRVLTEARALTAALGRTVALDDDAIVAGNRTLGHRPSILQDWMAGRPMEIDALYTVPLDLARMAGIAMPTLELLAALIRVKSASR